MWSLVECKSEVFDAIVDSYSPGVIRYSSIEDLVAHIRIAGGTCPFKCHFHPMWYKGGEEEVVVCLY